MTAYESIAPACCFCGLPCERWHPHSNGYGHNPEPLFTYPARCCTNCNDTKVIPARLKRMGFRGDELA